MKRFLFPSLYLDSIYDLNCDKLRARDIKGIIIDIDNTLVAWDMKYAPPQVIEWLDKLKKEGFSLCLVSNNTKDRVVTFSENLQIPAIHRAIKPRNEPFNRAMKIMGTSPKETAVIGDQIFTDILGGNRLGLFTILVVPIGNTEHFLTKIVRKVERRIMGSFLKEK